MIKHIIWDWNGTLFNDVALSVELGNTLLSRNGLRPITIDEYRDVFTIPVINYYKRIGFDFSKESFEVLGRTWMDWYESRKFECNLFCGVFETLHFFQNKGIKQYLLSAYKHDDLSMIIEHYGIKEYFEIVKGLDHIYADSKLHLGEELVKEIGDTGDSILLIGDTHHENEIANHLKVKNVLFSQGHMSERRLRKFNVPVISNIKDIANFVN